MGLFNFFGKSNSTQQPQKIENQQNKGEMKERLLKTLTENLSAHNFNILV